MNWPMGASLHEIINLPKLLASCCHCATQLLHALSRPIKLQRGSQLDRERWTKQTKDANRFLSSNLSIGCILMLLAAKRIRSSCRRIHQFFPGNILYITWLLWYLHEKQSTGWTDWCVCYDVFQYSGEHVL